MSNEVMSPRRVRTATHADAPDIARVHVEAWQSAYAELLPADALAALSVADRETFWRRQLCAGASEQIVTVVEGDDGVAGFLSAGRSRDADQDRHPFAVYALYVHPWSWRRGFGEALLSDIVGRLARNGASRYSLWVLEGNDRAMRFYEQQGLRADGGRRVISVLGRDVAEVRYIRSLRV